MFQVGQDITQYTLLRCLGAGGAAEVWLARHRHLDVEVALKLLNSRSPSLRTRLVREGRAQASLDHPNLLTVRDILEDSGHLALVLPLVRGPSLADAPRPDEAQAVALLCGILAGLAHAHDHGHIHRDLKPANILLDPSEQGVIPRIADFGLVKATGEAGLTRQGAMLGTLDYAAPEQVLDASTVDRRADLFSVGVLLVELLTGQRPFHAESLGELQDAHRSAPELGGLADRWRPLARALLAVDPDDRPSSCAQVADALHAVHAAHPQDPLRAGGPYHRSVRRYWASNVAHEPPTRVLVTASTESPADNRTLATGFADPAPMASRSGFLHAERDRFWGRQRAVSRLQELLRGEQRLISVLGPGGMGKTRLVLHVANRHRRDWPGGVWFCDLSECRDVDDAFAAVAQTLGVPLVRSNPAQVLTRAMAGRGRCLVILDNFEQLVQYAPQTVGRWLDGTTEAQLIVTSRERLAMPGERVLNLAPLDEGNAVDLFIDRVAAVRGQYVPTADELDDLRALVGLLDGLPLALELAAARGAVLSPRELLARMGDRFRLLATPRGRAERQATLWATLEWSWDLLDDDERAGLAQLSVFQGGFTVSAAEAVLNLGRGSWPTDVIQALVDKSLVRRLPGGRLDLWSSVQAFAGEVLRSPHAFPGSGPACAAAVERRHGAHFASYGTPDALLALRQPGGEAAYRRLVAERANLVVALKRALAREQGQTAARCALAVWAIAEVQGPLSMGIDPLRAALPVAGVEAGRVHQALGLAHLQTGRPDQAREHFLSARDHAIQAGDRSGRAQADAGLVRVQHRVGPPPDPARLAPVLATHRDLGERHLEADTLVLLGQTKRSKSQMVEAVDHVQDAIAIYRALGDRRNEALALSRLGGVYGNHDQYARARDMHQRAHDIHLELGNRNALGMTLNNLGYLCFVLGELEAARQTLAQARRLLRHTGRVASLVYTVMHLGNVHRSLGDLEGAQARFEEAIKLVRRTGEQRQLGFALGNLGGLLIERGRMSDARAHLDEALATLEAADHRAGTIAIHMLLGLFHARQGDVEAARREVAIAEAHLQRGDALSRGQFLVVRCEVERRAGAVDAAEAALREAEAIVERLGVGPRSFLAVDARRERAALHLMGPAPGPAAAP